MLSKSFWTLNISLSQFDEDPQLYSQSKSSVKNQLYLPNTPNYVREQMFAQLRMGVSLKWPSSVQFKVRSAPGRKVQIHPSSVSPKFPPMLLSEVVLVFWSDNSLKLAWSDSAHGDDEYNHNDGHLTCLT